MLKLFVVISCTVVTVWQCYNVSMTTRKCISTYLKKVPCRVIINFVLQCLILWSERNTKAIMSVKDTGSEEFLEFTVCPAYEHAYSDSGLAVSLQGDHSER